jgi:hypothetical protein
MSQTFIKVVDTDIYILNHKNLTQRQIKSRLKGKTTTKFDFLLGSPLNCAQQQYIDEILHQIIVLGNQEDIRVHIRLDTNTLCINSMKKKDAGLTFAMIDLPKNLQFKKLKGVHIVISKLFYDLALQEDDLPKAFFIFNNYCKPYFQSLKT